MRFWGALGYRVVSLKGRTNNDSSEQNHLLLVRLTRTIQINPGALFLARPPSQVRPPQGRGIAKNLPKYVFDLRSTLCLPSEHPGLRNRKFGDKEPGRICPALGMFSDGAIATTNDSCVGALVSFHFAVSFASLAELKMHPP